MAGSGPHRFGNMGITERRREDLFDFWSVPNDSGAMTTSINTVQNALNKIGAFANSGGQSPAPTVTDYDNTGVVGVGPTNIRFINDRVRASGGFSGVSGLQTLVDTAGIPFPAPVTVWFHSLDSSLFDLIGGIWTAELDNTPPTSVLNELTQNSTDLDFPALAASGIGGRQSVDLVTTSLPVELGGIWFSAITPSNSIDGWTGFSFGFVFSLTSLSTTRTLFEVSKYQDNTGEIQETAIKVSFSTSGGITITLRRSPNDAAFTITGNQVGFPVTTISVGNHRLLVYWNLLNGSAVAQLDGVEFGSTTTTTGAWDNADWELSAPSRTTSGLIGSGMDDGDSLEGEAFAPVEHLLGYVSEAIFYNGQWSFEQTQLIDQFWVDRYGL